MKIYIITKYVSCCDKKDYRILGVFTSLKKAIEALRKLYKEKKKKNSKDVVRFVWKTKFPYIEESDAFDSMNIYIKEYETNILDKHFDI